MLTCFKKLCMSDGASKFRLPQENSLIYNPTKWPNTLKQFVGKLPTNCLSVFDNFVKLALKGLMGLNIHHSYI